MNALLIKIVISLVVQSFTFQLKPMIMYHELVCANGECESKAKETMYNTHLKFLELF